MNADVNVQGRAASAEPDVRSEDAQVWVERFAEGWRAPRDADSFAEHFEPLLDPAIRLVQPQLPTIVGLRAFREEFAGPLFALAPDLHGIVEGWAAQGDTLYVELRLEGTLGRRRVSIRTVDRVVLRDGRAVERVAHLDPTPLIQAGARTPSAWPRFVRMQIRNFRRRQAT